MTLPHTAIPDTPDILRHRHEVRARPRDARSHAQLGVALLRAGRLQEGVDALRRATALSPALAALHGVMAPALHALGQHEAAIDSYRRALRAAPRDANLHKGLSDVLRDAGRVDAAADSLARAVALAPDNLGYRLDLGRTLARLRRYDESAACYRCVLEQRPDDAALLGALGMCQQQAGQVEAALATLARSVALAAPDAHVLRALGYCHFELGNWAEAHACWRGALELAPTPAAHSTLLFLLSHSLSDPVALTAEHRRYGQLWEAPLRAGRKPHANPREPERPIGVGFVSPDLHSHAVAQFITPVFAALGRSSDVVLHVYYNNRIDDATTALLRKMVPHWRAIADLADDAAEQLIRDDGIDILIDLAGHSALNRLPLFARKPAPVQATWIGYAGTTGLEAVDYVLSDNFALPEGRYDDQFTERIVCMPVATPFLPHAASPAVSPLPALCNGYLTFGSFHRANKIGRDVVAQWARLLRALPDARMLLGGLNGNERPMLRWFADEGIARERLILRERTHMAGYLGQHAEVDVCLSPLPYTGGTTVCHALWMGVPTLALVGATNPGHAAPGFLAHLGLSAFLAHDEDNYVDLGVFLAHNLPTLAALRAGMRERFAGSVLGNPDVVSASLALAWRKMWRAWCAGAPAAPIRVELAELVAPGQPAPA